MLPYFRIFFFIKKQIFFSRKRKIEERFDFSKNFYTIHELLNLPQLAMLPKNLANRAGIFIFQLLLWQQNLLKDT